MKKSLLMATAAAVMAISAGMGLARPHFDKLSDLTSPVRNRLHKATAPPKRKR